MIDSHCHLADKQFNEDLSAVLSRAEVAGIAQMMTIGDSIEESAKCLELAEKYDQLFCSVGVHPHNAKDWKTSDLDRLRAFVSASKKVKAIGETGLDYHYDFSPRDKQRDAFRAQVELANELDLPIVLHCREAVEDVWAIVIALKPKKLVVHCCTEKWEDVERFVDRGYLLSFTGIATYTNAQEIRNTIYRCPIEQMMIETDAPYLAPVPHRGKRNEPAFVLEVASLIAREKRMDLAEVDRVTTENAVEFFGLPT